MTDEQLVEFIKEGNENAYETLYRRYHIYLKSAVNKMNKGVDKSTFDILLSEANLMFCYATRLYDLTSGKSFRTYLNASIFKNETYRITRNNLRSPITTPKFSQLYSFTPIDSMTEEYYLTDRDNTKEALLNVYMEEIFSRIGKNMQKNANLERRREYIRLVLQGYHTREISVMWGVNESRVVQIGRSVIEEINKIHISNKFKEEYNYE